LDFEWALLPPAKRQTEHGSRSSIIELNAKGPDNLRDATEGAKEARLGANPPGFALSWKRKSP
jgi:hypothetical protein